MKRKRKRKSYFRLVFFTVGTVLLFYMGYVIVMNFYHDSGVFHQGSEETTVYHAPKPTPTPSEKPTPTPNEDHKTPKNPQNTPKVVAHEEAAPTAQKKDIGIQNPGDIRIQVIDYTNIKRLSNTIRVELEGYGFQVSTAQGDTIGYTKSQIIERSDQGAGKAVRDILEFGTVKKEPQGQSRFDVTVILGDDYVQK